MKIDSLSTDQLVTATGGQMLRNRSALDSKLTTQLQTLQDGIKDVATSSTTSQQQQQQQQTMMMMMVMMRRQAG